jgi:tetratricopeptide (TPR) repeat protein
VTDLDRAKTLFFEGLQLLERNDLDGAESRFAQALDIVPDRPSILANLAAVKIKLRKFDEAEALARKAVGIDVESPEAWSNLAAALSGLNRNEESLTACDRAIACNPDYTTAWLAKAAALHELKRFDEALDAANHALKLEPDRYEILYQLSLTLNELNRLDEAAKSYDRAMTARIASAPVHIGERRATQKAEILIINRPPDSRAFRTFESVSANCSNYPGQLGEKLRDEFHFNYIFAHDALTPALRAQIPRPHLVLNNFTNAEVLLSNGHLKNLIDLVDSFGVPVLNHPGKAVQTSRDNAPKLLQGVPGVHVPRTMRFSRREISRDDLARGIEKEFDYPLITRTLVNQQGIGMTKVDSRDILLDMLAAPDCPETFFVTQFIDSREQYRFYRKIRAAVVGQEIHLIRVDFSDHWNVHGRKNPKRVPFYLQNMYLLEEEKRICLDPESSLGRPAMQALRTLRSRIPLDVFGIDFDVDTNGNVVLYEANATMNLFSTADKRAPNPPEADQNLKAAFQGFFNLKAVRSTAS